MSAFFIIKENRRKDKTVWNVMEHNNRSPAEGLQVASFESREMAENYVKNHFNKDDHARENYYHNLQKQT